jgi:hypothetical protein
LNEWRIEGVEEWRTEYKEILQKVNRPDLLGSPTKDLLIKKKTLPNGKGLLAQLPSMMIFERRQVTLSPTIKSAQNTVKNAHF